MPSSRVLVVASRFNEAVTRRLLDGALSALEQGGLDREMIDTIWVPGAFELPVTVHAGLASGRYAMAVAVGALIRGETPHFDYIAQAATRGLADAAVAFRRPVGYGLLTCETMEQALARAGGAAGNKGAEAASAALDTARALEAFGPNAPA